MFLSRTSFARIRRLTGKAIGDFKLIESGDHIAVAVSGGKDSICLAHVLEALRRRAPIRFRLTALTVDPGFPGFEPAPMEACLRDIGVAHQIVPTNMARIISEKCAPGTSPCSLCARLRRGVLYTAARRLGCNKLCLGHHLDDFIETLLLNQFFAGTLAAMAPAVQSKNGQHTLIRPLVYVPEDLIQQFVAEAGLAVMSCTCPDGVQDLQRRRMKQLIGELERDIPRIRHSLLAALGNVRSDSLLDLHLRQGSGD